MLSFIQTACENAENDVIGNLVYINEASTAKTKELTIQEDVTRTSVTIRLAKAAKQDIKAELFMDEGLLENYNKKNETNYKMPKAEYVTFLKTVTIKAGEVSAEPVNIDIEEFETGGSQYAVPIGIKSVDGGLDKAEDSSGFMLVLVKPLRQLVPKFSWYNGMKAEPQDEDWNISLSNYTLEWWSKVSNSRGGGYTKNNQAIFYSGSGGTELYVRFGDELYGSGHYMFNFLQVKTMGTQFDSGDPVTGKGLEPNEWYHFAVTYDATTGTSLLYQNGALIATLMTSVGTPMLINRFHMISSGRSYFYDDCELCQVRLWKVTRSANQIRKNMYAEVEYTNKDLLLYYPMNEGDGAIILHDVTGNGHDIEVGNMYPENANRTKVTWKSYLFAQ